MADTNDQGKRSRDAWRDEFRERLGEAAAQALGTDAQQKQEDDAPGGGDPKEKEE